MRLGLVLVVDENNDTRGAHMLYIAILLIVIWAVSWLVFHVASGLIHLLLIFALISAVMHFVKGRSAA
jgi:hypothetical protein